MDKETLLKMSAKEIFAYHDKNKKHHSRDLDCENCLYCDDCFLCRNLINAQYCILNVQLTKEEYESKMLEIWG